MNQGKASTAVEIIAARELSAQFGSVAGARAVTHVSISVDDLETLAHGVEFARRVAHDLHVLFNDPAMERTQERIREAQKEAMRLVGLARSPK